MKKPTPLHGRYELSKILDYIEKKHKIPVHDFYGTKSHFDKWCDSQGYGKQDSDGKKRAQSKIWHKEYSISPTGAPTRPPLDSFWNHFFDYTQPMGEESFFFIADSNPDWPPLMNRIQELINKEFGDSFDCYIEEA